MDSLTQIVLGAAAGEAVLGRKVGNKAALWGAIAGTIPDLDVFANPFLSELEKLTFHRSISHSLLFCVLLTPILAWLVHTKIYKGRQAELSDWRKLFFWGLITHPLLDSFTNWGTQLFYPFSHYRVALNNICVLDPIYTVPFGLCLLVALFLKKENPARAKWNKAGIVISSLIMAFTFVNKAVASKAFANSLHQKGSSVVGMATYALPLNLLWYCVAEEPSAYEIGYVSVKGNFQKIPYFYIPKNHNLAEKYVNPEILEQLAWFSSGYYSLEQKGDSLIYHDLRFGLMEMTDTTQKPQYVFNFYLPNKKGADIVPLGEPAPSGEQFKKFLRTFWDKSWGNIE